jgi:RNA polymerase sigma-70 factor (ECF subfamily)
MQRRVQAECVQSRAAVQLTEELVRRHQKGVWRYLRFLGCPAELADDLTQETFLTLLQWAPEERGDAALAAWLRTTARNLFRMQARRPRKGVELAAEAELEEAWLRYAGEDPTRAGDDYLVALHSCLQRLEGREHEALMLRYGESASRREVASALGLGVEGAKTLVRRAKDKLRKCVAWRMER